MESVTRALHAFVYEFVRDLVAMGQVQDLHVPSHNQYADIFTKRLPSVMFDEVRFNLSIQSFPAPTANKC